MDFSKYFFQVCHVLGYAMGFDDHVVDIDLDIFSDLLLKDPVHESLVCSAYIFQAKGHDPIVEVGIFSDEFHFLFVWDMHPDLIVS